MIKYEFKAFDFFWALLQNTGKLSVFIFLSFLYPKADDTLWIVGFIYFLIGFMNSLDWCVIENQFEQLQNTVSDHKKEIEELRKKVDLSRDALMSRISTLEKEVY